MTFVGLLAFFGLAAVTIDVFGGLIAAGMLAAGIRPRSLLYFLGGYTVSCVIATILLRPLIAWAGRIIAPFLASHLWMSVVQIVLGAVLVGLAVHQRHSAHHPKEAKPRPTRDRPLPLILGGVAFSLTTFADPAFPVALGMAMQVRSIPAEVALLVGWNVVYQLPILAVTAAALLGWHERMLTWIRMTLAPRRTTLLLSLAAVLALAGAALAVQAAIALAAPARPWMIDLVHLLASA